MKTKTVLTGSFAIASLMLGIGTQSVRADEQVTTSTTTTNEGTFHKVEHTLGKPFRMFEHNNVATTQITTSSGTTILTDRTGPGLLVTNTSGEQVIVPDTMSADPVLFVTTGATITGFNLYTPDDLITRRDDLLARILTEKVNGKLSADQANTLISEVQTAFSRTVHLNVMECSVNHRREVKNIYRAFDQAATDIQRDSHMGNKQLAGTYSYIVL